MSSSSQKWCAKPASRPRSSSSPTTIASERSSLTNYDTSVFDRIFIWQGDYHLLLGIIKYVEDRMNVENDTAAVGVQSIILVEDNVSFYSSYLPLIYTEILNQSKRLLSEGVNLTHKFLRMSARPKILLCTTFEEAWGYYEKYQEYILGIISDMNFKRNGVKDLEAGIRFARMVRRNNTRTSPSFCKPAMRRLPSVLPRLGHHSFRKDRRGCATSCGNSCSNNFGFGDFVFRMRDGSEVGRAHSLKTLEEQLQVVPDESILLHAERNHFSNWLKARTEFWLAHRLRPRKISDFDSIDDLRPSSSIP